MNDTEPEIHSSSREKDNVLNLGSPRYKTETSNHGENLLDTKTPKNLISTEKTPNDWLPEALVIGPGGMKGYLELGALKYLNKVGLLKDVTKVIGCSIGSIIGLLYTVGYTIDEISVKSITVNIFHDGSMLSIYDAIQQIGILDSSHIKENLEHLVKIKLGRVPSLYEHYMSTGYNFVAVGYNLHARETRYMNYESNPSLSCIDAVMFSINIPGVFTKAAYNGEFYIDGFFGDPYPIDYFDDGKTDIIGLYIQTIDAVPEGEETTQWYLSRTFYSTVTEFRKYKIKHVSKRCKNIELQARVGLNFSLGAEDRGRMLALGWNIAKKFHLSLFTNNEKISSPDYLDLNVEDDGEDEIPIIANRNDNIIPSSEDLIGAGSSGYDIPRKNVELVRQMRYYRDTGRVYLPKPKTKETIITVPIPLPFKIPDGADPKEFEEKIKDSEEYQTLIQRLKSVSPNIKE